MFAVIRIDRFQFLVYVISRKYCSIPGLQVEAHVELDIKGYSARRRTVGSEGR